MSDSPLPPPSREDLDRLDARIVELRGQAERAYQAYLSADAALRAAIADRDRLTQQLFALATPARPTTPAPSAIGAPTVTGAQGATGSPSAPSPAAPPGPETSTRTVQNVLFVLGGLLLGTAAIAFTVVAWATYGVLARVAILATLTLLALALPVAALARGLRATAETFAAIGLLLVALDGYAVWYVDFAGARSWDGSRYAGLVAAITAGLALGYGRLTRLAGPAFVALIVAQPVTLFVAAPARPGLAVIALLVAAVAAVDALVVAGLQREHPGRTRLTTGVATGLRAVAWLGFGTWLAVASVTALLAEATSMTVALRLAAGAATIAVSLVTLLGAWVAKVPALRPVAAGVVVVAVVIAVFLTAIVRWPERAALLFAATALAVNAVVRAVGAILPAALRSGPRWAATGVTLVGGVLLALIVLAGAAITIAASYPLWSVPLTATGPQPPLLTWELPVALVGLTVAALVVGPRSASAPVAVGGGVLAVLALPSSLSLQWWTPPVLALGGAVVLVAAYLRRRGRAATRISTLFGASVLTGDAVLTSAARPVLTALVLAAVAVLGLVVATVLRSAAPAGVTTGGVAANGQQVGAVALVTGLLALPPAVGSALRAAEVAPWWALRATVGAAALLLLAVAALRRRPSTTDRYLGAAFLAAVGSATLWPLVALRVGDEAPGIYSGVSLLLLAAALGFLPTPAGWARGAVVAAAGPNAAVTAVAVIPAVLAVSVLPYAALGSVWTGRPSGVGLGASVHPVDAVALVILAAAGGVGAYAVRRRLRSAVTGVAVVGPTAALAVIVAARAPWPALPAATLAVGTALLLWVAVATPGSAPAPIRSIVLCGQAAVYGGAGLAGALRERWTTLTALGVVVVACCVVGALGRTGAWRVFGCVAAVAAVAAEASVAGLAVELPLRLLAFVVLAAGVAALFAGAWVRRGSTRRGSTRRAEAIAVEAAANGVAAVAFALAAGTRGVAAGVCAVWGLALATRALVPGITVGARSAYACAGGGLEIVAWWLLLSDNRVSVVEAYTLPLAAMALVAGWAALRVRPELRSWVAYGPALLAGLLPTLALVLVSDAQALRRLALGTAALLCVVLGSARRRQAPVVVGGVVLALVALHELVLLWQRLPGWIPLALGGALLLFLAVTYERRRRDLAHVRSVLRSMT